MNMNATSDAAAGEESARRLIARFERARAARSAWEAHWQESYDFVLPHRQPFGRNESGERRHDRVFDATAADAVEQLAASLLGQLTPPWSRWFGFVPGPDLGPEEKERLTPRLERMAATVQGHLDRSNFAVEIHQCYLDLVTAGTASLLVEEAAPGEPSALRFTAVPLAEMVLEEGTEGRLDRTYRMREMTAEQLLARFPDADLTSGGRGGSGAGAGAGIGIGIGIGIGAGAGAGRGDRTSGAGGRVGGWGGSAAGREPGGGRSHAGGRDLADDQERLAVLEAVLPDGPAYRWQVVLAPTGSAPRLLADGRFSHTPFISFRWLKSPGESYGRSPVMKALPDIKTANKVVELVLKNASIAVTGMWQADDDGVLNPATIRLVPGAIIPKAVGSAGLTPLANPARFDVSQLVLDDLRRRIRHALYVDRLGQVDDPRMTATEVLERAAEMARLLGATYGRLQAELLTPLLLRVTALLRRRGEIPDLAFDGRLIALQYRSPLAQAQAQRDIQATLRWLESGAALGAEAMAAVDLAAAARWLGEALGVPATLIRPAPAPAPAPAPVPVRAPAPVPPGIPAASVVSPVGAPSGQEKETANAALA